MAAETILQHWLLTDFVLPFLLIFAIIFALLEKSKILGDDKKQINAIIALVVGLIFVGVAFPKLIVGNMVQFLAVAIVIIFVTLLLWGFATGSELKTNIMDNRGVKWTFGIVLIIAVILAILWATGTNLGTDLNFLFGSSWSSGFWTNLIFIAVIVAVVVTVARTASKAKA